MEKPFNIYSTKSQGLEVKDLDEGSRKVALYLSKFDNIDSDNDIIRRGAFKKSIQQRGPLAASNRKIAFLRFHNWEMPIGKFLELSEDEFGLYAVAQLGKSTLGNDALADYKDGIINEHSIGFKYVKDKIRFVEDSGLDNGIDGYYEISEVNLFEGSAVTFGANEYTPVVEVAKTEGRIETLDKLGLEIDTVLKAIKGGQGSDDRQYNLEMKLKYLNAQLLTLAKAEPFEKHSVKNESLKEPLSFNWAAVTKGITG